VGCKWCRVTNACHLHGACAVSYTGYVRVSMYMYTPLTRRLCRVKYGAFVSRAASCHRYADEKLKSTHGE